MYRQVHAANGLLVLNMLCKIIVYKNSSMIIRAVFIMYVTV